MRREIAGEILRFLEGEKYLREMRVARNRKIWEGGDGGRWGLDTVRARLRRAVVDGGVTCGRHTQLAQPWGGGR